MTDNMRKFLKLPTLLLFLFLYAFAKVSFLTATITFFAVLFFSGDMLIKGRSFKESLQTAIGAAVGVFIGSMIFHLIVA